MPREKEVLIPAEALRQRLAKLLRERPELLPGERLQIALDELAKEIREEGC